ncbi:MAG: Crp/Fnr family transcriptional regulator [Magnetococcales bacterium]|nr:Crp/Fnr family transcriptional regulator [Magnetococcales bacterium]
MELPPHVLTLLRRSDLFVGLSDDQMRHVVQNVQLHRLSEGELLFDNNQQAERFFFLHRGQIKLYRISPSGQEKIIEFVKPGEFFAVAVMFMERTYYPVCASALMSTHLYSFDNRPFITTLRESPETCFRVMAEMSKRLRCQVGEIDSLSLQSARSRLVDYLLQQIAASKVVGTTSFSLSAPKKLIASRLSIQPETFSRLLNGLQQEGLITVDKNMILVHDIQALRNCLEVSE